MATPASRSLPAPAGTALPSPFRAQPPLPRSLPAGGGGSSRSWRCGELGGSWQGLTAFLLGVVSGVPPSSTLIQSPFRPPPSTPQLLQPPHNQTDSKAGWMAASSTRLKNFLVSLLSASTMLPGAPTPHPLLPVFLRTAEGFLGGSDGKESACNAGDPGRSLGQEDLRGKEMATHSRILVGIIPRRVKPGRRQSVRGLSMHAPHTGFLSTLLFLSTPEPGATP